MLDGCRMSANKKTLVMFKSFYLSPTALKNIIEK